MDNLTLTSPEFDNETEIPSKFTCDGDNINPPLKISGVPEDAMSLVLIVDDPDALEPAGKVWDHWVVWNIPPETKEIMAAEDPNGIHGTNSSGNNEYEGPCPPDGEHTYHFKLYALDSKLELPMGSEKSTVENAMEGHIIDQAELLGRYSRS